MKSLALAEYRFRPRWSPLDRFLFSLLIAILAILLLTALAYAQATGDTSVSAGGWYKFAEPYLLYVFGVIWTAIAGLALTWFRSKTGIQLDDAMIGRLNLAARNAAGRILASQEGNVSQLKFDVHNPWIKQEANKLQGVMQDEIKHLGWTPQFAADRLNDLIHAKIGVLQTSSSDQPALH